MKRGQHATQPLLGLVVEGKTEYQAIPEMLGRMKIRCTTPSCFHGQPVEAHVKTLVDKCLLQHVRVQMVKNADKVVVILDRESRLESLEEFRKSVLYELQKQLSEAGKSDETGKIEVIVCDRRFENWIISDPKGISRSNYIRHNLSAKVNCHADDREALALLKSVFRTGNSYSKSIHGPRLAKYVRVEDVRVQQCSASLRKFLDIVRAFSSQ